MRLSRARRLNASLGSARRTLRWVIVPKWKEAALIWQTCNGHSALIAVIPFGASAFSSFLYLLLYQKKLATWHRSRGHIRLNSIFSVRIGRLRLG